MIELNEEIEQTKNDTTKIGDTAPKIRLLQDVVNQGEYTLKDLPQYQTPKAIKMQAGFNSGIHEISKTATGIEIWGGQATLSIGGVAGSKTVENFGRSLIKSAYDEAESKDRKYMQRAIPLKPEEYSDFSYALGSGVANYGGMLAIGYLTGGIGSAAGLSATTAGALTEVAGIGSMFALELSGKAQDKISTYIEKGGDIDFKNYTADIASKDFMYSAMYAAGSAILEKKFGFGQQRKLFKMPMGEKLKNIAKTAISEGGTEFTQSLYESGIDLVGGYIDFSKLPERFMQALQEGAVGAVLGGGAGTAAAINHRSQAKAILREELGKTVPSQDLDKTVDAVFEEADGTMRSVIAQELIQSEELRNKHGNIYNQIRDLVTKQVEEVGAYAEVDEAKKAQYIELTAKQFADDVLAEANKRGVVIDDVLKAKDISYKDQRIYLKELTEEEQKVKKVENKVEKKVEEVQKEVEEAVEEKEKTQEQEVSEQKEETAEQAQETEENKEDSLADIVSEAVEETGAVEQEAQPTGKIEDYGEKLEGAKKDLEYNVAKKQTGNNSIERVMSKVGDNVTERTYIANWLREQDPEFVDNLAKYNHKLITVRTNAYKEQLSKLFKEHENELNIGVTERLSILYGDQDPSRDVLKKYGITPERDVFIQEGKRYIVKATPEYVARKLGDRGKVSFQYAQSTRGGHYLWVKKGSGGWHILESFSSKEEMEDFKNSHTEEQLEELLKEKTDVTPKEKPIRKRQGEDYRNGKNVDAKDFTEAFGFRGVQFGNYENNEKRQRELNNAYDSLMDLANILNIPPRAISLEGKLGIAFGARGSGSAAAHYEPSGKIINITRDSGAGAIGHEWFHALDNYLAGGEKFATGGQRDEMRIELRKKMVGFLSAIEMERDYQSRLALLGQYWKRKWEIGARAFEVYLVKKMEEKGVVNDYLAQDRSDESPYLNKEEQEKVLPRLDEFFSTLQTEETEQGIRLYQFGSVNAKTAALEELEKAKQLEIEGVENEEIRQQTGWFKGADDKWRFEISDKDAEFNDGYNPDEWKEKGLYYDGLPFKLSKVLKHDKLYAAYPEIGNLRVEYTKRMNGALGNYNPTENKIYLDSTMAADKVKSVLMHEIQHAIQYIEGFARGGSTSEFESMEELKNGLESAKDRLREANEALETAEDLGYSDETKVEGEKTVAFYKEQKARAQEEIDYAENKIAHYKDPFEAYQSLGGEIEARNTQARMGMTEEERRAVSPESTQDIKSADAIIVFPDGTKMAYEPEMYSQVTGLPRQKKAIKGSFDRLTKSIGITDKADFSTYQHEFSHFWLDNIWDYVQSGKASEAYKKQFDEVKKWLGVKPDQTYFTSAQHEKFARGYEKWLYKGEYPNPVVGGAFKDYEDFIREVYNSVSEIDTRAGKKYKPLPPVMYEFFDSMVTGELPGAPERETREVVESNVEEVKEVVKEEEKIVEKRAENYKLEPVQTDTKTGYLTAYEKMTGEKVEAGVVELKPQLEKAREFVENNPEQAKRIVDGLEPAPEGMLKNTIYIAYQEQQKRLGNTDNRVDSLLNQALELRRMGQEISSQRLAYADQTTPAYWISKVMDDKASILASKNNMAPKQLNEKIKETIRNNKDKDAKEIAEQLRSELGVTELYQSEVEPSAFDYIYKFVEEQLGLGMSKKEAREITRRADDMLADLQNSMSKTGNPSVNYFVKLKEMENYANSLAPSPAIRVAVSVIGRGNLLASIKSPTTNIVSNAFVGLMRALVRRGKIGVNNVVDPELIKENRRYSWEIFRKTGYNVNNITAESPRGTILGEKVTHSEGAGLIRKVGRFYNELIYKWGLGAGDVIFKDYAFTDYVALRATQEAKGNTEKANKIFSDACLIEPKTDLGQQIRTEAIEEALIATYQQQSAISETALKARKAIDFKVGFGEFIAPFAKTPANVVDMGIKASVGSVYAIASEIKRDLRAGKLQVPTKENIDLLLQNGLGLLLSFALMSLFDDDDYMPPYALASAKDKQLAKELNIPYNSVRIGDTWVNLEYLGPLAAPFMGLLQGRREDGFINSLFGYTKSAGIQALSIPALGNISGLFESVENLVRKEGEDAMIGAGMDIIQATYARLVPAIMSDFAKAFDEYERETNKSDVIEKIQAKIPFARNELPEKVSVTSGQAEERGSGYVPRFLGDILFGARVKTQVRNNIADEFIRLNRAGYGVSLTPITQSGLLSKIDDSKKQQVRVEFAKEYSKKVAELIEKQSYKKASDEDKRDMINKIRRKEVDKLKKKY